MTAVAVSSVRPRFGRSERRGARELNDLLDPEILAQMGWDPVRRMLSFPADHRLLGWKQCETEDCTKQIRIGRFCGSCRPVPPGRADPDVKPPRSQAVGLGRCAVPDCARPAHNNQQRLCHAHLARRLRLGQTLEQLLADRRVKPFASYGLCRVAACPRDRDLGSNPYCEAHRRRFHKAKKANPRIDELAWRAAMAPIPENNDVSLRGLPPTVVAEVLYGLQERIRAGIMTKALNVRTLANQCREQQVHSIADAAIPSTNKAVIGMRNTMLRLIAASGLTAETEVLKDEWNAAVFGLRGGTLRFGGISQPWLREATKKWTLDDLPRHRRNALTTTQTRIRVMERLSESLRLQRRDRGNHPEALGREDIVAFLNRLAFLASTGEITDYVRYTTSLLVRFILHGMRAMGLGRPGGPLYGLPDHFTLHVDDTPKMPESTQAARDLPPEVMNQLCQAIPSLSSMAMAEIRVAIELLIDTGRRPEEICVLAWDCLERDHDNQPVLIFDNLKAHRLGRRLPIPEATAAIITTQKERTRSRFPHTALAEMKLLPRAMANPDGRQPLTVGHVSTVHRRWVEGLDELNLADGTPFDRASIVPYSYRHTYAQRHADAGVPVDVLRELMDHRQLSTTQRYYRVGEQRRREAVERVAAMQFDRHGNRVWRSAKQVLDTEHARRAVSEVAVPYGLCGEPSNVAAGGQDCPVRYRCIGCGHFRTDVSYLPELETYLADLLRIRERIIATVDVDDWARAEGTPSDEEITRVRRLIDRIRGDLHDLPADQRQPIDEAVTVLRRTRANTVALGLPKRRTPVLEIRTEAAA